MTKEEKQQLLFKDLCTRMPYGVKVRIKATFVYENGTIRRVTEDKTIHLEDISEILDMHASRELDELKLYLRPLSSMTEEEILDLYKIAYTTWYSDPLYYKNDEWITFRDSIQNNTLCFKNGLWLFDIDKVINWLYEHHFDFRGLLEKGLALPAPEGMYN